MQPARHSDVGLLSGGEINREKPTTKVPGYRSQDWVVCEGDIAADYGDRRLTLVSVLKGSLPFMADLMRSISIPVRIDLMEVSSYGGTATESSGLVRILKDLSASIEGEEVLIVEDIIDTGLTLNYLLRYLRGKNPRTLRICTLLDKPARRLVDIPVDYVGFTIPDQFVVGYGLDYAEYYRNLRFVGVLRPEVYSGGD